MPFRGRKKKVKLDTLVFIGKQLKTNVGGKKGDKRPSYLLASLFKKKTSSTYKSVRSSFAIMKRGVRVLRLNLLSAQPPHLSKSMDVEIIVFSCLFETRQIWFRENTHLPFGETSLSSVPLLPFSSKSKCKVGSTFSDAEVRGPKIARQLQWRELYKVVEQRSLKDSLKEIGGGGVRWWTGIKEI